MQQGVSAEQSHGHGFVLSRVIQLPLTQFFPCSISHSSLTNKAELSTERGGGALPDGSARLIIIFHCLSFVPFAFFFACRHYSADSLLNPSPHPFSSQAVTALLLYGRHPKDVVCGICYSIWYICCSGEL